MHCVGLHSLLLDKSLKMLHRQCGSGHATKQVRLFSLFLGLARNIPLLSLPGLLPGPRLCIIITSLPLSQSQQMGEHTSKERDSTSLHVTGMLPHAADMLIHAASACLAAPSGSYVSESAATYTCQVLIPFTLSSCTSFFNNPA